ncbi:hypothetical protein ACIBG7_13460 [Nonomuraea sp. NPDC050328]|uniref:hypothetical protein n=1 Tax=Nonomuraea sp. NPDC050328 TaxID=3364361 RepID=UPI00378DD4E4
MPHNICALVVAGPIDTERAGLVGLHAVLVHDDLHVFPIDHYYSAYWSAKRANHARLELPADLSAAITFPGEAVLRDLAGEVSGTDRPRFAIIQTEYFAGTGSQWAVAFEGVERLSPDGSSISQALAALGVRATATMDEFEVLGLTGFRGNPDYLDDYVDLCDELGV